MIKLTLDRSTPVSACTAGGSWLISLVTSDVVLSSPTITISSTLASGADTSAATYKQSNQYVVNSNNGDPYELRYPTHKKYSSAQNFAIFASGGS